MDEARRPPWSGWSEPASRRARGLPARTERFLADEVGLGPPQRVAALEEVRLRPACLPAGLADALRAAVGAAHVRDDRESRVLHAGGKGYPDLLRRRAGDATSAPDAVVLPGSHDEVRAVLDACVVAGVAVVPFGGGTSVVGGVEPDRGPFPAVVAVDLARLDGLLDADVASLTVTLQPGLRGPEAERLLAPHGLTLGHLPQSVEYATLGGYVATRSAGQASSGYGRFDANVLGLRAVTPVGDLALRRGPATAAGPDLLGLLVGSEGTLGIVTEVTLRAHPRPEVSRYEGFVLPGFAAGCDALRVLAQAGLAPTVARLADEEETCVGMAQSGGTAARLVQAWLSARGRRHGALAVLGWEGSADAVAWRRRQAWRVLRGHGALRLGRPAGARWLHGRYAGPYQRDALMDRGLLVETFETAAPWSRLGAVHSAVRTAAEQSLAARGRRALVLCHVSHLYPTAASLYFTVLARQEGDTEGAQLAQWQALKTAASEAVVAAGATITHHHGVGRDHAPYLAAETGDLGLDLLRSVKDRLDPTGVLNPGVLFAPGVAPAVR